MRTILILCLAACGSNGTGSTGEICTQATCPSGGHTYKYCAQGNACRYLGSDNSSFQCQSCADCVAAANQIANWCSNGGTTGSTTSGTNGSTTSGTNGATNGSTTSGTTNGSTTSGTNGATNGATTSGTTTGAPPTCDVAMQNCTGGQKCVGFFDGSSITGTCVANGTVAQGQTCTSQMNSTTISDNCEAGLICDDLFGNFPLVCRKICAADTDCAAGEKCGDFLFAQDGWGWCAPSCTPFSSAAGNCAAGMDCGETDDSVAQPDPNSEAGFFLCKKTGAGTAYSTCTVDSDCGANLWCGVVDQTAGTAACLPNCNSTTACTMPKVDLGTAMCNPLTGTPNGAGYCTTQ